jgi:DNA-binding transcriptional LysR family regulator
MPYAVYAGRDLSVAGVEDGPWIALAETECWFLEVKTWIDGAAGPKVALRVNTITGAHEAARRGVGLAVLPMFIGDGDVALRRVSGPALRSRETLIAHRDLLREPAVRRVADALVAIYRRHERDAASRDDRGLAPAS